ncbi:unnamed protein product [Paramecium octaurelia]|uniref:Major facilitator superfamily (MFS) profile domain-containing protein n=1 Tax=Paramecium octaurelia TaxID=43137 RepID=A0A8S1XMF8_PAROT|nr:unnamed protein product [Paramecium octaurelia]
MNQSNEEVITIKQSYIAKQPFQKTWVLWLALALACFLLFGDAYAFDNPMALQSTIQTQMGLNNVQFNMLYSIYSAPNIILPFFGGILIDKIGVRVSIFIFSTILIFGQGIVVIGGYTLSYGTLLAGRCIFGIGSESLNAAQAAIMSKWFEGGMVSLALGLCLSIPKLGSALNSFVSPIIQANHNELGFTFLVGLFIVLFSWGCGLFLIYLDKKNEHLMEEYKKSNPQVLSPVKEKSVSSDTQSQELSLQLRTNGNHNHTHNSSVESSDYSESFLQDNEEEDNEDDDEQNHNVHDAKEEIKISDLKNLDGSYWILSSIIMLSEALFVPFLDNGNAFFQVKFGFSQQSAGVLLTIPYVFAALVTPIIGIYSDKIRQRSLLIVLTTVIFIVTHLCLLLIHCDSACGVSALPLLSLGLCYSFYSAILIPSIPLVVKPQMIGTAFGLLGVMQNTALALFPLITGSIYNGHVINEYGQLDPFEGYVYQSYFFVGVSFFNCIIAISLYIFDKNGSQKLSKLRNKKL